MINNNNNLNMKKLMISIITIIIVTVCFLSTTFALIYDSVSVKDNYYQTGMVDVYISDLQKVDKEDINGSLPINSDSNDIELDDFIFEPGMTVVKSFYIENRSTCDVYYRLYLDELKGDLANIIEITITIDDDDNNSSNDTVLFSNVKASNLSKDSINDFIKDNPNSVDELEEGESKSYKIYFHYPSESNNSGQDKSLSFKLSVEATQTKNNADKEFNN